MIEPYAHLPQFTRAPRDRKQERYEIALRVMDRIVPIAAAHPKYTCKEFGDFVAGCSFAAADAILAAREVPE